MTTDPNCTNAAPTEDMLDRVADRLHRLGYLVLPSALPAAITLALQERIGQIADTAHWAGVGRGAQQQVAAAIRTDRIHWLNRDDPAEAAYLHWMEGLRLGLNRRLNLGLFEYEAHFAVYEPGAYYRRHLDAFQGSANRVLSTVFYLNPAWSQALGGQLLIYESEGSAVIECVSPASGTMALFLSAVFPHEVLPGQRLRHSIAGWFRIRGDGLPAD